MTTIVKISGKPIADPANAAQLWCDLSAATHTVLVHGGGKQVDRLFARLSIPVERKDGIRLTSEADMPLVAAVLAGEVNQSLVALLRAAGAYAVGLSLASAGTVTAEVDPGIGGRVGRVTGGDASTLRTLLDAGALPVVASIAADESGGLLNINADDAAAGIGRALHATRVVLLTDVAGVLDHAGNTIASLDESSIEEHITTNTITGGMIAKVRSALSIAHSAHQGVLIASWRDAQRAIAGDATVGTLVSSVHTETPS
ncbi:MAG: acetylglutamate kinase [Planctomycetota bacterium]